MSPDMNRQENTLGDFTFWLISDLTLFYAQPKAQPQTQPKIEVTHCGF